MGVWEALSDLPPIKSGARGEKLSYRHVDQAGRVHSGVAKSHLQLLYREGQGDIVTDHICKTVNEINELRIRHIPTAPGSDWRDLPNKMMSLPSGQVTNVMQYPFKKLGDKQSCTIIPWALSHTADKNNNWHGSFGRVPWLGAFKTTITDPEPMGKQGTVLHPDQDRLVSVRECARSQGFKDRYQFVGKIRDKHKEIGNAVPPPMSRAIGLQIRRAVARSDEDSC